MTTQKSESVIFAMKIHWNIFRPLLPFRHFLWMSKMFLLLNFMAFVFCACMCVAKARDSGSIWSIDIYLFECYLHISSFSVYAYINLYMLSLQWSHSRDYSNNKCYSIQSDVKNISSLFFALWLRRFDTYGKYIWDMIEANIGNFFRGNDADSKILLHCSVTLILKTSENFLHSCYLQFFLQ